MTLTNVWTVHYFSPMSYHIWIFNFNRWLLFNINNNKYKITPKWTFHLHKKNTERNNNNLFLVTWDFYSIHHSVIQFDDVAYNSLHLIGRDILSLPAEGIPRSVTEIKVSKFVHNQYVTYKRIKVQIVQIDAKLKHVLTFNFKSIAKFQQQSPLGTDCNEFSPVRKAWSPFLKTSEHTFLSVACLLT